MPAKQSPTIGKCIYCGSVEPPLSTEHVVPYGLGGNWTLVQASCESCSNITSAFERNVLRKLLWTTRAALNIRSRRKEYPNAFPIEIEKKNEKQIIDLEKEKHGAVTLLPRFAPPAFLDGHPYKKGIDIIGQDIFRAGGVDLKEFAKKEKIKSISFKWDFSPTDFAKMLAKIAYGFSVWSWGLGRYSEVYILPSILNQKDEIGKWVGTITQQIDKPMPAEDFVINFFNSEYGHEFAQIKLFGKTIVDPPIYVVAIGKLAGS